MTSQSIEVWVDPPLFKNITDALRLHHDSEYVITALNANFALKIIPTVRKLVECYHDDYGVIKVEIWKEGLVLWVDGQIKWKSWENNQS